MHRLFVAIEPPEAVRATLLAAMGGVAGARWQDDSQLHLTVRFIGEVDRHQANDIAAALSGLRHPPFEIAVSGVGTFDTLGQVHTLWAGVTPHEPLRALHKKVERALTIAGVAADRRAYAPHITLARLNRSTGPLDGFVAQHAGLTTPPFRVESVCLYESNLTADGAVYDIVERVRLGS